MNWDNVDFIIEVLEKGKKLNYEDVFENLSKKDWDVFLEKAQKQRKFEHGTCGFARIGYFWFTTKKNLDVLVVSGYLTPKDLRPQIFYLAFKSRRRAKKTFLELKKKDYVKRLTSILEKSTE